MLAYLRLTQNVADDMHLKELVVSRQKELGLK